MNAKRKYKCFLDDPVKRKRFEREYARLMKLMKPMLDEIDRSTRITDDDLRIIIR